MRKYANAEILLGFMLGTIFILFFSGVTSYQAELCSKTKIAQQEDNGSDGKQEAISEEDKRKKQNQEYANSHPWICGVIGIPQNTVWFMDQNEGFIVGIFTAALFFATFFLWRSTEKLWTAGEKQLEHVESSAQAAGRAADVATETLISSNRAWIKVGFSRIANVTFNNDLLVLSMSLFIQNLGNVPATQIRVMIWPFIDSDQDSNSLAASRRLCEAVRREEPDGGGGATLFPNESISDELERLTRASFPASRDDVERGIRFGERFSQNGFVLRAIVCVDYCFSSDKRSHQSRMILNMNRRDGWISFEEIQGSSPLPLPLTPDNPFGLFDYVD